jgi:hypothetical protein
LYARQSQTSLDEQENWMRAQGPISTSLFEYLRTEKDSYDAFIFFGYLYATTYFGLPLVAEKSYLAPLAHDESPIYFTMWDTLFSLPNKLIFNSDMEREFLRRRFSRLRLAGPVAASGIRTTTNGPARSLPSTRRPKQSSASKECAMSRTTTRGRASKTSIRLFCNPRWNRPGQYPAAPERKCEVGCHFHSCFEQPLYKSGPVCKNARQILKAKVFHYLSSESYFAGAFITSVEVLQIGLARTRDLYNLDIHSDSKCRTHLPSS